MSKLLPILTALCALPLLGCADGAGRSRRAWYKPSALTIGITAPGLISTPPIVTRGAKESVRHNGAFSAVGMTATLTFPLFPTPTLPERPAPAPTPTYTHGTP